MSSNAIAYDNENLRLVQHDENEMCQFPPAAPSRKDLSDSSGTIPAPSQNDDLVDSCSSVNPSLVASSQFLINDEESVSRISSNSLIDSFDLPLDHESFKRIGRREVARSARLVIDDQQPPIVSFTAAYVLACFVFWLCGFVAGSLAYIEAVKGEGSAYDGDTETAKRRRKTSYYTSIVGISIGLIVVVTALIVLIIYYSIRH